MKNKLNEQSLRPEVLKDLIFNIISVDEYTPKLNPNNIVICFQVMDSFDAAYDLSSFIERYPINVLDTEAAENPNVDSMYPVFVELERNAEFPDKMLLLIKGVSNLCPNVDWKLQMYGINDPIDLTDENINDNISLSTDEELTEFFKYASNVDVLYESEIVGINSTVYRKKLFYRKSSGIVNENHIKNILNTGYTIDDTALSTLLGENYTVLKSYNNEYLIECSGKYFILR